MSLSAKLRRAPMRVVTGAFILNSGVGKLGADEGTAKQLHGMAAGAYPFLGKVDPKLFAKGLAAGEIALGGAVLLPIVPPVVAGLGLVGFSGALLNMWWNTEGMHEPGSPRPTVQGTGIAKDVWMFGIGAGLLADSLLEPAHDKKVEIVAGVSTKRAGKGRTARKAKKQAAKQGAKASNDLLKRATEAAAQAQSEMGKRAAKAAAKAQKQAVKASAKATKAVAGARSDYGPAVTDKARQAREAAQALADTYGPVAADKAKQAREAAKGLADTYGPVAAEKAQQARDAAQALADTYGPVAADKFKQARQAAQDLADSYGPLAADYAKQAREAAGRARTTAAR